MKSAVSFFLLLAAYSSYAQQKETFDLATYVTPQGWKKTSNTNDVISYAITNNQTGTYCQIGIYKSTGSKGNLQADFESEWQELVIKSYKPTALPKLVPSASENGWDAQGGAAPFEFSGAQSVAMLVTMSGYSKCMSIVILTNTEDYQSEIEKFLESVNLKKLESTTPPVTDPEHGSSIVGSWRKSASPNQPTQVVSKPVGTSGFQFSTINFDDGWTSTEQEDWVEVRKSNVTVLIHYPNKKADAYNSVVLDGLQNAWNILVAAKYSEISNLEFKPIGGWQTIEFAEADAIEKTTGKTVHVVLFKMNYSNGSGRYLEFITPDKNSFEQEFGSYHQTTAGWEKMEGMATYNKFAVAASDLTGNWTNDFSGALQYVNAYTGADAGMDTHASNERFEFGPGNSYKWSLGVASGQVGNIKFQSVKSSGNFSLPDNWKVTFSDMEGKPRTFNAFFSCVKGARMLWLDGKVYGRVE